MIERSPAIEEERELLTEKLAPIFGKDAAIVQVMLIRALGLTFGCANRDLGRYLSALRRLPRGGTARPRVENVSFDDENTYPGWTVMFTDDTAAYYQSAVHFSTKALAYAYGTSFVECLEELQKRTRLTRRRTASRPIRLTSRIGSVETT